MKAAHILILALSFLFLGCSSHINEITSHFDIALGDEYKPNIKILSKEPPERVLIIPVFEAQIPTAYTTILLQKFRDSLSVYDAFYLDKKRYSQAPTRAEIEVLASEQNCASVMLLHVRHPSVYPPIRVTIDVVLERLRDNLTILKGNADYDSRNEEVSSSARRYSQLVLRRPDAPDKSLAILKTNPDFFEFCGWHVAKFINFIVVPPIKDLNKDINDPKNIQDFEPTEIPDAPKPLKPVVPGTNAPATGKKTSLVSPKEKVITPTKADEKTSEQTTSEEQKPADAAPENTEQKFAEPPPTLQNKIKNTSNEDRLQSEDEGSTLSGRTLWLKNR